MIPNFFRASRTRKLTLLLTMIIILTAVFGSTLAYIVTKTPALLNTFLSGLSPSGNLSIHKVVEHPFGEGYQIPEDMEFTFSVNLGTDYAGKAVKTSQGTKTADDKGVITVSVKPGGTVSVLEIAEGTSVTVAEDLTGHPGFSAKGDQSVQTVTILKGINEVRFINVYSPSPVEPVNLTVTGVKLLEGRDWQEGDFFTFRLEYKLSEVPDSEWTVLGTQTVTYELAEQTDPADPDKTELMPKPDYDKFDFTALVQELTYSEKGIYSFRISEEEGSIGGIAYDKVVSYFDVHVGDADMDGALEIQSVEGVGNIEITRDEENGGYQAMITVKNIYRPEGSAQAVIEIGKTVIVNGGEVPSFVAFTFELYDESGQKIAVSEPTSAAGETGIVLNFQAEDAGKQFHYVLKEAGAGETVGAMTYDEKEYRLTVSVVDNGDGTIRAYIYESAGVADQPVTGDSIYKASFTNIYDPKDTEVTLSGAKVLQGRPLKENEFSFNLYQTAAGFAVTEGQSPIQTVKNDTLGQFVFASLLFDRVGRYYYVVTEDDSAKLGGITYDETRYLITVVVADNGGKLERTVSVTDHLGNPAEIKFNNDYNPAVVSVVFTGRKVLQGASLTEGMFSFNLFKADENFNIQGEAIKTAINGADEAFAFGAELFSGAGEYFYVIAEDSSAQKEGIVYDETVYGVRVTVTDDGEGRLTAEVTICVVGGGEAEEIVFVNTCTGPVNPDDPTIPDASTDPDDPTDTDAPTDPDVPTEPETPFEPVDPGDTDTGDSGQLKLYLFMMAASLVALTVVSVNKLMNRGQSRGR